VQHFLDKGWNVVATMRRPDASLFVGPKDRLCVLPLDITDRASIDSAIAGGLAAFGAIDVLVNNAGIGLMSAFEVTPEEVQREIYETNVFGMMAMCRGMIPHMRARGKGTIVNVTSSTGVAPMPFISIYSSSKWAIEGFSEALSYELSLFGIKVKLVQPGMAPSTSFGTNVARRERLMPPPYERFTEGYFAKLQNYPTAVTTIDETVEAIFAAASDEGDQLRYPAGADTVMLADLRKEVSEREYLQKMHEMFVPAV
jgi:NAD(P)-dependent dehydrogenase (short-subunit alcohol dehydrogenase family)